MGLPFYGTSSDNTKKVRLYRDIIEQHPNLDPSLDEIIFDFGKKEGGVKTLHSMGNRPLEKRLN